MASLFFLSSIALMNACDLNSASLKFTVWDRRASISAKVALWTTSYCRTSSFLALSCSSRAISSRCTGSALDRRRLALLIISLAFSVLSSALRRALLEASMASPISTFLISKDFKSENIASAASCAAKWAFAFERQDAQALHQLKNPSLNCWGGATHPSHSQTSPSKALIRQLGHPLRSLECS